MLNAQKGGFGCLQVNMIGGGAALGTEPGEKEESFLIFMLETQGVHHYNLSLLSNRCFVPCDIL